MPHEVARSAPSTALKRSLNSTIVRIALVLLLQSRSHDSQSSSKKRRLALGKAAPPNNNKGKQRAYERTTIPLPDVLNDVDVEDLSDQDVEFFTENLATGCFLEKLDQTGIARQVDLTQEELSPRQC
jgi:hypothetical protein